VGRPGRGRSARAAGAGAIGLSEDVVEWGLRTNRYPVERVEFYRGRYSVDPQGTTALIRSLYPLPADLAASIATRSAAASRPFAGAAAFPSGDEFRANPLVDDLRRTHPSLYAVALGEAPPPTLFASGDLPVYTASGVDSAILASIPWMARHAVASAETTAEAYRIIEAVSGPDGVLSAHLYADHPGVREYENRVRAWAIGPPAMSQFERQQLRQADAASVYEEMFRELRPPGAQP
jgi:hypothetical protein